MPKGTIYSWFVDFAAKVQQIFDIYKFQEKKIIQASAFCIKMIQAKRGAYVKIIQAWEELVLK